MRNSDRRRRRIFARARKLASIGRIFASTLAITFTMATFCASRAFAQQPVDGFAVERLYPAAAGGGWFVMDDLSMQGGLGAAASMTSSWSHRPLHVKSTDGAQDLDVVSNRAFVDVGVAVTYDRFRFYLDLPNPTYASGTSGVVGGYRYGAPSVDIARRPDLVSDPRVGFDARLLGAPNGPFRLGVGAQLFVPNGELFDYDTDDTFRAMFRLLFAGDLPSLRWAAHVGAHVRPRDDGKIGGTPQGHELLFGLAAGPSVALSKDGHTTLVVGPEVFGARAFKSFFGTTATALEALLTGRLERTRDDATVLRLKLAGGAGLHASFGAPEWRVLVGVEVLGHH